MKLFFKKKDFIKFMQGSTFQRKYLIKAGFLKEVGNWLLHGKYWEQEYFPQWDLVSPTRNFDLDLCRDILGAFLGFEGDGGFFGGRGPTYKVGSYEKIDEGRIFMKTEAFPSRSHRSHLSEYVSVSGIPVVEVDARKTEKVMSKAQDKWCLDPEKFGLARPQVLYRDIEGVNTFYLNKISLDIWDKEGGKILYGILFDDRDSITTDSRVALYGFPKLEELFSLYKRSGDKYELFMPPQVNSRSIGPLRFMLDKLRTKWNPIKEYMDEFEVEKNRYGLN